MTRQLHENFNVISIVLIKIQADKALKILGFNDYNYNYYIK